ncbi:MAG: hypothetical protein AAFU54_19100 [Chloroflexota bacterium]
MRQIEKLLYPGQPEWGRTTPLFSATIYRLGGIFFLIVAAELLVGGLWREVNTFAPTTTGVSAEVLWAIPIVILLLAGLASIWMSRVRISEGMRQDPITVLVCVVSLLGVLGAIAYMVWMRIVGEVDSWSLPYLTGMVVFWSVCLLVIQCERIASGPSGQRKWGFSLAGYDYRDTVNIVIVGCLFFSASHLVIEYDPLIGGEDRPVWLLPIFAVLAAVAISTLSTKLLRFPLAASIAGFLMLAIRNSIYTMMVQESIGSSVIPVILGPVFLIDLWQWYRSGEASTLSIAVVACIGLFLNYPIFDEWLGITIDGRPYAMIVGASFVLSIMVAWLSIKIANSIEAIGDMYDGLSRDDLSPLALLKPLPLGFVAINIISFVVVFSI